MLGWSVLIMSSCHDEVFVGGTSGGVLSMFQILLEVDQRWKKKSNVHFLSWTGFRRLVFGKSGRIRKKVYAIDVKTLARFILTLLLDFTFNS